MTVAVFVLLDALPVNEILSPPLSSKEKIPMPEKTLRNVPTHSSANEAIRVAEHPSDGTISCSACKGQIEDGEQYYQVGDNANELPALIRGGHLHATCIAGWLHPERVSIPPKSMELFVLGLDAITTISEKALSSLIADRDAEEVHDNIANLNIAYLGNAITEIADFSDKTITEFSALGAHDAAIDCAVKADECINGEIGRLDNAIVTLNGVDEPLLRDVRLADRLKEFSNALKASSSMLCMHMAKEYFISNRRGEGYEMLREAVARCNGVSAMPYRSALATDVNVSALHALARGVLEEKGNPTPADLEARKAIRSLSLHMLSELNKLDISDRTDVLTAYDAMAAVFSLLNMRREETSCYAILATNHKFVGEMFLDRAKVSLNGKPASSLYGDEPVPPNRNDSLIQALRARRHFQSARDIWHDKLSEHPSLGGNHDEAMPYFDTFLSECEMIIEQSTWDCKVKILP